ncbi:MAG: 5-deoxy-glucuronate isomerase [Christensenellales bacterium]|jgi:5-deoxy-glucuronate isomerase
MFGYPEYANNKKIISRTGGKNKDMMMDITLYILKPRETRRIYHKDKETAVLLLSGRLKFDWLNRSETVSRKDVFSEDASCLHFPKGVNVKVTALTECEILVQSTTNERDFAVKLYRPEDIQFFVSCQGKWENTAVRDVKTVFDYTNAPYSNMVLGEVIARQGRWWSYIPHNHPQPEVYYYKFQRPEGFGACFIGETAYTIKDGSYGAFPGGMNHPQVTAPGYPMYCCWMIRHLLDNPWTDRIDDSRYTWLTEVDK